jgi:nucleotide-binding universal stress UspA family protein
MARHLAQQDLDVEVAVPHTPPDKGILAEIDSHKVDLVVMTTHGRTGLGRWLYGSVAEAVLRHCPVPIWLVRAWAPVQPKVFEQPQPRLLVPLDGSPFGEAALSQAVALARVLDGVVVLLHVLVPPPIHADPHVAQVLMESMALDDEDAARRYLEEVAGRHASAGAPIETVVRTGNAVETILAETWAADIGLLVMATHGWTGLERMLFGSVAADVLKRSTVPLVVVRPTGLSSHPKPSQALVMTV